MADKPLTNPQLGEILGISRDQASRYVQRGCPREAEGAMAWKAANILPRRGGPASSNQAALVHRTQFMSGKDLLILLRSLVTGALPELFADLPEHEFLEYVRSMAEFLMDHLWPWTDFKHQDEGFAAMGLLDFMEERRTPATKVVSIREQKRQDRELDRTCGIAQKRFAKIVNEAPSRTNTPRWKPTDVQK